MKLIINLWLITALLILISCNSDEPEMEAETTTYCLSKANLCSKKYNEVSFACTHNAYNYSNETTNFVLPNQSQSIQQQLDNGVRALMLDVYYHEDKENVLLYHGTSLAGTNLLANELKIIKSYLTDNPTEIVTLILECYVEFVDFKKEIESNELMPFLYHPKQSGEWPILQEMIDANERLIILTDIKDDTADDWYIYVWDVAFETHYSNKSRADFSCNPNRGDETNDLFIFNHFITHAVLGTGLIDSSLVINQYDYLLDRLTECQTQHSQLPNFVTVDFYNRGNVIEVVNYLNSL